MSEQDSFRRLLVILPFSEYFTHFSSPMTQSQLHAISFCQFFFLSLSSQFCGSQIFNDIDFVRPQNEKIEIVAVQIENKKNCDTQHKTPLRILNVSLNKKNRVCKKTLLNTMLHRQIDAMQIKYEMDHFLFIFAVKFVRNFYSDITRHEFML